MQRLIYTAMLLFLVSAAVNNVRVSADPVSECPVTAKSVQQTE